MKKKILFAVLAAMTLTACTPQYAAKHFGGNMEVDLEPGYKLEEVTWKNSSLWYLVRPMREGEEAETHKFYQSTDWKVFEGCITINEQEKE